MPYREGYYSICGDCVNSTSKNAQNHSNTVAPTTLAVQSTLTTDINASEITNTVIEHKTSTSTRKYNQKTKEVTAKPLNSAENTNILHAPVETSDITTNSTIELNETQTSKATVLHDTNQTSSANKNISTKSEYLVLFLDYYKK